MLPDALKKPHLLTSKDKERTQMGTKGTMDSAEHPKGLGSVRQDGVKPQQHNTYTWGGNNK